MEKVASGSAPRRRAVRNSGDATPAVSPRLIEEAARIFVALGITATDLRLRAKPGSPLGVLADAIETPSGTR
jgi:hypothetical protein